MAALLYLFLVFLAVNTSTSRKADYVKLEDVAQLFDKDEIHSLAESGSSAEHVRKQLQNLDKMLQKLDNFDVGGSYNLPPDRETNNPLRNPQAMSPTKPKKMQTMKRDAYQKSEKTDFAVPNDNRQAKPNTVSHSKGLQDFAMKVGDGVVPHHPVKLDYRKTSTSKVKGDKAHSLPPINKNGYVADVAPKAPAGDVEVDHVEISQSISGEAGVVDLKAHGKRFTFNLKKAKNNPSDVKVTLRGQDREEIENIQKNLKDFISFSDKSGSSFLVEDTGKDMRVKYGRFHHEEHEYLLEPSNEEEGKHAVKRSALASWDTDVQIDQVLRAVGGSVRRKRSVTEDGVVIANIGIKAMLDLSVYRHHFVAANNDSSLAVEYVTVYFSHIFNLINLRYANIQNPRLIITVSLVEIDLAMDDASNGHFRNNSYGLDAVFGDLLIDDLRQEVMNDQVDGSGNYQFDHLMAFTYLNLWHSSSYSDGVLGMAYLSGICDHDLGLAVSVVEASPNNIEQTVNIAAHELAHNLGANHDENEECKADAGWIMSAFLGFPNELFFYFSCCSQREFWSTLAEGKQCTDTVIEPADSYEVTEEAGQAYDVNYICQLTHNTDACPNSFYEDNEYNICGDLWCVHPHDSSMCLEAGLVPPTGTECEVDKWCIETLCVDKTENQTTVYHGPETCDLSSLPVQGDCLADQYMCDNGTVYWSSSSSCYDRWRRCDQSQDCIDGSDERGCPCPERLLPCGGNNSSAITECFYAEEYCNGWTSCANGKDELNCNASCTAGYLRCDNYGTITSYIEDMPGCYPQHKQCDGNYDCYDLSDEKYPDVCHCDSGEYCERWINGRNTTVCITDEMRCNGYPQCENYEDEYNCTCYSGQIQCANLIGCYYNESRCDGYASCQDRSDEYECDTCPHDIYRCTDGSYCLADYLICDRHDDCDDGSDEEGCTCEQYGDVTCPSLQLNMTMYNNTMNNTMAGGQCIYQYSLCDGYDNCDDGYDESLCNVSCPAGFSRCEGSLSTTHYPGINPHCFNNSGRCDWKDDCWDSSDENNCTCDPYHHFTCYDGSCIPNYQHCNGMSDCSMGEDELFCSSCWLNDQYSCESSSTCLDVYQLCDGYYDCPNGDDEYRCNETCGYDQFRCENGFNVYSPDPSPCISSSWKCDGITDCSDWSDERSDNCSMQCDSNSVWCNVNQNKTDYYFDHPYYRCISTVSSCNSFYSCLDFDIMYPEDENCTCSPGFISCGNSTVCVSQEQLCNGYHDCPMGEDEYGCESICGHDQHQCYNSSMCIQPYQMCNGYHDCPMEDDELGCNNTCSYQQYSCESSSTCLDVYQLCDGYYDCPNGDDEHRCNETCGYDQFRCENGFNVYSPDPSPCISSGWKCDGITDCSDWSDERADNCSMQCDSNSVWCNVNQNKTDYYFDHPYYRCISTVSSCNNFYSCLDFGIMYPEDENCTCSPGFISCGNSTVCVSQEQLCNGYHDCPMGEDEYGCESICGHDQHQCYNSSMCIQPYQMCNGYHDCPMGDDELGCNNTCSYHEYTCYNGTCIDEWLVCDGYPDCSMGEDEFGCGGSCEYRQYSCESSSTCLDVYQLCDGYYDCPNGDDEHRCNETCGYGQFRCENGFNVFSPSSSPCISSSWKCDGITDCSDWSDERADNCSMQCDSNSVWCNVNQNKTNYYFDHPYYRCISTVSSCNSFYSCLDFGIMYPEDENCTCSPYEFPCSNGSCIPQYQRCNGLYECPSGEDEEYCNEGVCGSSDMVLCPNSAYQCIYTWEVCNGYNNCGNGTDEFGCDEECVEGQFRCETGANRWGYPSKTCLWQSSLCDGYADCYDGSDEQPDICSETCLAKDNSTYGVYCRDYYNSDIYFCVYENSSITCNGFTECAMHEDETMFNCSTNFCSPNELQCPLGGCISYEKVCDGIPDCEPFFNLIYDEFVCGNNTCGGNADELNCNGTCVPAEQFCDGVEDCSDGRDEQGCEDVCPTGSLRCDESVSLESMSAIIYGYESALPPRCYNSSLAQCVYAQCLDRSDVKECTCQDYVEDLYGLYNSSFIPDEYKVTDAVYCATDGFGFAFSVCLPWNSSVLCDGDSVCLFDADEWFCDGYNKTTTAMPTTTTTLPTTTTTLPTTTTTLPTTTTTLPSTTTTPPTTTTMATTTETVGWVRPEAWNSTRLYPFGNESGDTDLMADETDWKPYFMCVEVELNGIVGAAYFNDRYKFIYICNNGMMTFNLEWRLHYPEVFESWFYSELDIIAPFWGLVDDASMAVLADELPDARLRVYYHAYTRSPDMDMATAQVLQRATEDVADSADAVANFTASYALVVTWLNQMPADGCDWAAIEYLTGWQSSFPEDCRLKAERNTHFNHFQAVLITDGVYTFVKFNYPENGINWLLKSLHAGLSVKDFSKAVDSAGDMSGLPVAGFTYVKNSLALSNESSSMYIGSRLKNLDLDSQPGNMLDSRPGEYLFRVEWSTGVKLAESECIEWNEGQLEVKEMYKEFSEFVVPCPTVLWQTWWDSSFQWDGFGPDQTMCYKSIFAEDGFENMRQRCCYSIDWFAGTFSELIVGAPYGGYPYSLDNVEVDQQGYQKCCVDVSGMCRDYFYSVRWSSNGDNYEEPSIGPGWGDPHIATSDGLTYSFNGLGEYLFTNIDSGSTIIQTRTERVPLTDGSLGEATYFSAVCVQTTGLPKVQMQVNKNNNLTGVENELQLIIDGTVKNISLIEQDLNTTQTMDGVNSNIRFKRTNSSLSVYFNSGLTVTTSVTAKMMVITLEMPSKFKGKTVGLTGVFDDNQENDLMYLNMSNYISTNSTESQVFDWASTFAVSEADSIMYYTDNTDWYTYNNNSFRPVFIDDIDNWVWSSEQFKTDAYSACSNNTVCLYDTYVTGDLSIGTSSKKTADDSIAANAALSNFPPKIFGADAILVTVGEPFDYVVKVNDSNGDEITVTTNIASSSIMNGDEVTITATVTNTTAFKLTVTVKDPAGAASSKTPLVMLCNCANGGTCEQLSASQQAAIEDASVVLSCICPTGYTGALCDTDLDACALVASPCYPSVPCVDSPAPADHTGYTCGDCPVGYTGNGKTCSDIDECTGDVCGQICINSPGSFVCSCQSGYSLNTDGSTCDDVNECLTDPCHQVCNNAAGSYSCGCDSGFVLSNDNINCEPANPCEDSSVCDAVNGYCSVINNNNVCSCKKGYNLNADGSTCDEIDECAQQIDSCSQNCTNTVGGYTCGCTSGYQLASDGFACDDINECVTGTYTCDITQTCSNIAGGYECTCAAGQVLVNGKCQAQDFEAPVKQVTTTPEAEAVQNAVMFSLRGMTVSEYTLLKEINLFTTLAYSATQACLRTSCGYASVSSEAKRRRKRSTPSVTFYKEYFSRLPGYPQIDSNGDLQLAIYTLVPGTGVLNSQLLKQVVDDAKTNVSLAIGANIINLVEVNPVTTSTQPPTTTTKVDVVTETPSSFSAAIIIGASVGGGLVILGVIIIVVVVVLKKGGGGDMKTVYPISDPELSRKTSQPEPVRTRKESTTHSRESIPTPEPVTAEMVAESTGTARPKSGNRPMSGKHVQEHVSRVPSVQQSMAPLDGEGLYHV